MATSTVFLMLLLNSLIAGVLFVVFTYLHEQSRAAYFRAWQVAWASMSLGFLLWYLYRTGSQPLFTGWASRVLFAVAVLLLLASTRMEKGAWKVRRRDAVWLALIVLWGGYDAWKAPPNAAGGSPAAYGVVGGLRIPLEIEILMAALLAVCVWSFWKQASRLHSLPYRMLCISLGLWTALLLGDLYQPSSQGLGVFNNFLGPLTQLVIGIAMVMVLYENERRAVQENLLAFSSLDMDTARILEAKDLEPALREMLQQILEPLQARKGALWMAEPRRRLLPGLQLGFSEGFMEDLDRIKGGEYLMELLAGGRERLEFRSLEALGSGDFTDERARHLQKLLKQEGIRGLAAVSLQTRGQHFGVILAPQVSDRGFGSSQLRLLSACARQLGMTLENHVLMQEAARRTEEYELLTQIGQVVSSRLDPDEVLRTVHRELGRLFDTKTFYVAFTDGEDVRYEFESVEGAIQPKRSRTATNGITEHIVRSGEPLLIRHDMEKARERMGLVPTGRPASCFCGVPVFMYGRAVGVMAAFSHDREYVYEERDLDVMKTAAGQVAVAMENARLFAEEQRRSKYLEFLNNVSKAAISSQEPDAMMADIVSEIQSTFRFDHIGIGILDYANKDIEIKAEAGTTEKTLGRHIPLGVGILGRVARSNEMVLMQSAGGGRLLGILPDSKSVLCIPITYSESLLGVLNVESRRENAFAPQEVLILRTLADLLATALHNAFVFQKMQQQSITDGLTGIKTRRYFNEALLSEWKRASRTGRPFSVVLIDLDKFKSVNDSMGHLEGDLVLARIGRILEQKSRQSNVVARYGGDEFIILMPETGVDQAQILSERLRLWIATDTMLNERQITGSFGVATFPAHGSTVEEIIRMADMGMYTSKRAGGNHVSTPEEFGETEQIGTHKKVVTAFLELFLQRESIGPESMDDLMGMLMKLTQSIHEGDVAEAVMEALVTLNHAAESRESAGTGHGESVAKHAEAIARELGMPQDELTDLIFAARVHDLGKLLVAETILNKEEPLRPEEMSLMQMHPVLGARMVSAIPASARMTKMVRHHHERFDGNGYPDKLRGEEIPLGARIIAVAEAYAHITLDRPYAAKKTPTQAFSELEQLSGTQFDGMVVRMFLSMMKKSRVRSEA